MSPELRDAVFALSVEERVKLAEELWESVEDNIPDPPPQWLIDELERREEYLKQHPDSLQTWEQVLEHIHRKRDGR